MRHRALIATLVTAATALAGCADAPATSTEVTGEVLVSAAASLTDAFAAVEQAFEQQHEGVDVVLNLAGSATLREQVLAGAPVDVVATASETTVAPLVAAGALADTPQVFATNRLVIAVPAGNPGAVSGLEDLADEDLFIGLCSVGVPCGDAARAALAAAGVTAAADTTEPDVRALLTKVAAGELDAGMTYVTDVARDDPRVEAIALPASVAVVTRYPIAVVEGAANLVAATAFVAFVRSPDGRELLAAHGFGAP